MEITPDINGRKYLTKYDTHVKPRLQEVLLWLKEGKTEYSIAEALGITQDTLIEYKKNYSEFSNLYVQANSHRNANVINSMYSKATGHIATVKQEKLTREGEKVILASEIYTPPDVNAADLYLRNNMPGYIQPRGTGEGSLTVTVQLPGLKQELDKLTGERAKLERELLDIELGKDQYEVEPVAKPEGRPLKAEEESRPGEEEPFDG